MRYLPVFLAAFCALPGAAAHAQTAATPAPVQITPHAFTDSLAVGKGSFLFADKKGTGKTLTVHYFRPEGVNLATAPILFVMHGTLRNGAEYRDMWVEQAIRQKFLLLVPEFSAKDFPSGLYNRGNVRGRDDEKPEPEDKWTFSVLERIFDDVLKRTGSKNTGYYLYGHSAGGQFVHRFMLLTAQNRCLRAVAANAGYYTLPTRTGNPPYPFSLAGVPPIMDDRQKAVFRRELIVLLGEADTDSKDPDLYHSPEADAQGMYRFARGKYFFASAQKEATRLGVLLAWKLQTVPGVGHSNEKMAPAAAEALFTSFR